MTQEREERLIKRLREIAAEMEYGTIEVRIEIHEKKMTAGTITRKEQRL